MTPHHGYALNNSQAGTDGGSGLVADNTKENDLPALEPGVAQQTLVAGFGFSLYRVPVNGRANVTIRMPQGADKARILATFDRMIYSTGKRYELNYDAQSDANGVLTVNGAGKTQIYLWVENKFSHASPGLGQEVTWVTLLVDSTTGGNTAPVANFTSTTANLTASFTDTSTDSDGSIASRAWEFGDGTSSTAANPSHTYSAAGTYPVKLTATDDDGATHAITRSVTVGTGGGTQTYTNDADAAIPDNTTVTSTITVSGRTGNAPSNAKVAVSIVHPNRGQLTVSLVAPDGSVYTLKNSNMFDTAANVNATYTVNLSSEALNGAWKLRVNDFDFGATGRIDSWNITF